MKDWLIVGMMIATMFAMGVLAFSCTVGILLVGSHAMDLLTLWQLLGGSCVVLFIGLYVLRLE